MSGRAGAERSHRAAHSQVVGNSAAGAPVGGTPSSCRPKPVTSLNTGAATVPPHTEVRGLCMITATAMRGSSAGATPMNDVVMPTRPSVAHDWAVPVLPATR